MPQISRQDPKPAPRATSGVLSKAIPISDLEESPVKLLIYGQNRVGKTTLACQFPKPLLLVSFEPAPTGGADSVRLEKGVVYLGRPDWTPSSLGAMELAKELRGKKHGYKTVVIDTASSLQDVVLAEILDLPEVPDTLAWGTVSDKQYRARSEKAREVLRPFINLSLNTVILARERDHNPPKEERISERTGKVQPDLRPRFLRGVQQASFIAANLGGATVEWLQDACNGVCRLFVEEEVTTKTYKVNGKEQKVEESTGKYIRYLRTTYHPNYAAGIRSPRPNEVPEVMVNPTYEKIIKLLR